MGQRNWLFVKTEMHARHVGTVHSSVATCQQQGINPNIYLADVLRRVDRYTTRRIVELTPRVWKDLFAGNPLRSDLGRAWGLPLH